MAQDESISVFW